MAIASQKAKNSSFELLFRWTVTIACMAISILLIYNFLPVHTAFEPGIMKPIIGVDWKGAYRPGILKIFSGESPYSVGNIFNPPWALWILSPIALLAEAPGSTIIFFLGISVPIYVALRMGAKPLLAFIFGLSPAVLGNAINGNIDWLVALGFILPRWLGLFFVLIKPQIGIAIAIYWVIDEWRKGSIRAMARLIYPVAIGYLLSYALYGAWMTQNYLPYQGWVWNASIWPWGIPIGLLLITFALIYRRERMAILASPFLTPYLTYFSWAIPILGLLPKQRYFALAILAMWLIWAINGRLSFLTVYLLGKN